jgi:thymidylate synthase
MKNESVEQQHEEQQYLQLVRRILETGVVKVDRTGVGTLGLFGTEMRFSLRDGVFPLLTTKRVFWSGVLEELFWFIRGDTCATSLSERGVKIWDANGTREFLDKRGLTERAVGDLGPVYGFQWRHYGARYVDAGTDYTGQGVDQLQQCIDLIRHEPTSRRIVMTAWNPCDTEQMALPPCHMFCQFEVANGEELNCLMYQRSGDMGLGVPFNIASYALLTCLVAHCCSLRPGTFIHMLGDTHVYRNHVEQLRVQVDREPRPFPTLRIRGEPRAIDAYTPDDVELVGYTCHGALKMEMAV